MIKYLSLFSGIGAFEQALTNIGIEFELINYCEIDKYASKSYATIHNIPESKNLGDITQVDINSLPLDLDLITHGSPCQDFSVAGKNAGGDVDSNTRSSLMWNTVEIVKRCKPKYVIWENVKNVLSKKHKHNFDLYLKVLHDIGYKSYYKVLNAKNYGVPQNRERIFVVSIRNDLQQSFMFPNGWKLDKRLKDILELTVEDKYYISQEKTNQFIKNCESKIVIQEDTDKINQLGLLDINGSEQIRRVYGTDGISPTLNTMQGGNRQPKLLIPQATQQGYIEMNIPGICDLSYPGSKTRRGRVQEKGQISPTLMTTSQDLCYIEYNRTQVNLPCICASRGRNPVNPTSRKTGDPAEQQLEINYNGTSNTLTTVQKDNLVINTDFRIRKLTPLECWRLMGFSDDAFYKAQAIPTSNTQLYKQAGNSIVVPVLEAIFKKLLK